MDKYTIKHLNSTLTKDDKEVIKMFSYGVSATDIGKNFKVGKRAIDARTSRIRKSFGVESTIALVAMCLRCKIIK